ncbi:hypothetical protein AAG570_010566, partial [Ranatra chinensis]
SDRIPLLLNVIELLGDPAIKTLNISKRGDYINWYNIIKLFSLLDAANIIGLNELDIKSHIYFQVRGIRESEPIGDFYNVLKNGLASNLRVLVLHSGANNGILEIIGKHAVQLSHLEITCSWLVDDSGIASLLLKNYSQVISLPWDGLESQTSAAIRILSLLPTSEQNRTCDTLCEVKIQDTNTSFISVVLLLMFAKNLKSFGGFLYDRNIGDIVLEVHSLMESPSTFALTKLWDMDLPPVKLEKLSKLLPKLSHLYTRTVCLLEPPDRIPQLTDLTADFGLVHYDFRFYNFLENYGKSIRRLVLLDQVYGINLAIVAEACPLLEELSAKVYVDSPCIKTRSLLANLRLAEVRICSPQTFSWLMKQADNIKHLEVLLEQKNGVQELFENSVITKLVEDKPKSLKSITRLGIHIMMRTIFERLTFSCGLLHIDAAYTLCRECPLLTILGELETWMQVSDQDVYSMAEYIKNSNWNVKLRYRNKFYPAS